MTKEGKRRPRGRPAPRREETLETLLERAYIFLRADQPDDALDLLEPLRERYPHNAPLFILLGDAYAAVGNLFQTASSYERALALDPGQVDLLPKLLRLYAELDMPMHVQHTARRMLEADPNDLLAAQVLAELEAETVEVARRLNVDLAAAAEGCFYAEAGQLALACQDLDAAISSLRQAVALLPRWPPPRNNLAIALSLSGGFQEALALTREVLEDDPDNLAGLWNMVRFLSIAGEREEAQPYWERLRRITPQGEDDLFKIAEAAAAMEEDAEVYRLLRPLFPPKPAQEWAGWGTAPSPMTEALILLAAAAANLGRREEALQYLDVLAQEPTLQPWTDLYREALQAGRPGPGWAERYPYPPIFPPPEEAAAEISQLIDDEGYLPEEEVRARGSELARRYPILVPLAEIILWVAQEPEVGVPMLRILGTPRAVSALWRYATGQAGPDEGRKEALMSLARLGALPPDRPVRVWLDGEWRDILLRVSRIGPKKWPYDPKLFKKMERAQELDQQRRYRQAEQLYRQVIAAEPRMKEAYANLSALYARQGRVEEARALAEQALEIDPLYVFPRCNLALTALGEGDIAGARNWVEPLETLTDFSREEAAFYHYTLARILAAEGRFREARESLEISLIVDPEYELALDFQEELPWMELAHELPGGMEEVIERLKQWQRRSWENRRRRIRSRLQTPNPTVAQTLETYPKGMLTGMAQHLLPQGIWSTWKKGQLAEALHEALLNPENLARVVAGLSKPERSLLREVVKQGGSMPAEALRTRYGDEREESPYWEYHLPESPLGRLQVRGLVVTVQVGEEERVVVPVELREMLPGLLKRRR